MNRLKAILEFKSIFFVLLIILMIGITGSILYNRLALISKTILETTKGNEPASLTAKKIILDLQDAENKARNFQLTRNYRNITLIRSSFYEIEKNIIALKRKIYTEKISSNLIDSFANLAHLRFDLIETQSSLSDPTRVAEELDLISEKIESAYPEDRPSSIKSKPQSETTARKRSLFKRIFNTKETENEATIQQPANADFEGTKLELQEEVLKVKASQKRQLEAIKKNEYEFTQTSQLIAERMNEQLEALVEAEASKYKAMNELTRKDIDALKNNAILFSGIILLLLFLLIYLIVSYILKKQEYEAALLESKKRSDDLANAKEMFLANMSHEIKTPLNAIHGFAEQLLSSELNKQQQEQINIVKNSASYLTKLVGDILTLSKLQAGKSKNEFEQFHLINEFKEIEALFLVQAEKKNIEFIIDTTAVTQHLIVSDLHKIKQVLFNIIGNAIKFTEKGKVFVEVQQGFEKEQGFLMIVVSDTGIGIDKQKKEKLFREYEQGDEETSQKYGGTGLGLYITKQIIQQLGGNIELESTKNIGTKVTVQLPIGFDSFEKHPDEKSKKSFAQNYAELSGKRILIVDDEEFNRLLLKSIFAKYDITIIEATNGEEAVDIAQSKVPDLILMDIRMPVMNGIDATIAIRKFNPKIPIIASTAVASEEKISRCIKAGVNSVVFKPFKESELISSILEIGQTTPVKNHVESIAASDDSLINFEALNDYTGSDLEFKKEMILTFKTSISNALIQLKQAQSKSEYATICDIAHKILPSCKHFEAEELALVLKRIEQTRENPDNREQVIESGIKTVEQQVNLIVTKIDDYLKG